MKKSTLFGIIASILLAVGVLCSLCWIIYDMYVTYEATIKTMEDTHNSFYVEVYTANQAIPSGTTITEDMVVPTTQLMSDTYNLFTASDIGSVALVDIKANSRISKDSVTLIEDDETTREVEYTCFYVGENTRVGDYIDVRIRFTNGEDFTVLSKKRVNALSDTNKTCLLSLNEYEAQKMASAVVDSVEYSAIMYATLYTQPTLQEATTVNYPMRRYSAELVITNKDEFNNELSLRKALESRISIEAIEIDDAVEVSNLSDNLDKGISNTNNKGSDVSSDYTDTPKDDDSEG